MRAFRFIVILIAYTVAICSVASAAELPGSAVTIYVEDNSSGGSITDGSGVIISPDGLIATDIQLVLAWLESDGNSLFVRSGDGYYPLKTLIRIYRDKGIALIRIDATGLSPAPSSSIKAPAEGDSILVVVDEGYHKTASRNGVITGLGGGGSLEMSIPVEAEFRGAPVLNTDGEVIGMALRTDGKNMAFPIGLIAELAKSETVAPSDESIPSLAGIKKAKRALQSNRAGAEDYLRMGVAYTKANMPELSIEAFKKAVELKPGYAKAYHGLGVAYASQKMYDEALEALQTAVKYDATYAKAYANLGFLYDYLGKHDEAVASFTKAIDIKPEYAEAYNGMGVAYARVQNYEEAVKAFKDAIRLKAEFKQARFNLGLSYMSMGDEEGASREEASLRAIDPALADQLLQLMKAGKASEEIGADIEETNADDRGDNDQPQDNE